MLKRIVQQGRKRRKTGGVPSGYVEDLVEARTQLADRFSIRLRFLVGLKRRHLQIEHASALAATQPDRVADHIQLPNRYRHRMRTETASSNSLAVGITLGVSSSPPSGTAATRPTTWPTVERMHHAAKVQATTRRPAHRYASGRHNGWTAKHCWTNAPL